MSRFIVPLHDRDLAKVAVICLEKWWELKKEHDANTVLFLPTRPWNRSVYIKMSKLVDRASTSMAGEPPAVLSIDSQARPAIYGWIMADDPTAQFATYLEEFPKQIHRHEKRGPSRVETVVALRIRQAMIDVHLKDNPQLKLKDDLTTTWAEAQLAWDRFHHPIDPGPPAAKPASMNWNLLVPPTFA